ncbi:MAG: hypothetical protein ACYCS8_05955 [Acidithiobacillus sp.]
MEHRHLTQPESASYPTMAMVDDWLVRGDLPEMRRLLRLLGTDQSFRQAVRKMVSSHLAREDPEMEGRPKYALIQTWLGQK